MRGRQLGRQARQRTRGEHVREGRAAANAIAFVEGTVDRVADELVNEGPAVSVGRGQKAGAVQRFGDAADGPGVGERRKLLSREHRRQHGRPLERVSEGRREAVDDVGDGSDDTLEHERRKRL